MPIGAEDAQSLPEVENYEEMSLPSSIELLETIKELSPVKISDPSASVLMPPPLPISPMMVLKSAMDDEKKADAEDAKPEMKRILPLWMRNPVVVEQELQAKRKERNDLRSQLREESMTYDAVSPRNMECGEYFYLREIDVLRKGIH